MYVFDVGAPTINYATNGSINTEDAWLALRQATQAVVVKAIRALGKGAALTDLTSIGHHMRRWTTVGSGGTALTPSPRAGGNGVAATTVAADKQTALTPGTVSGVIQAHFGHGAASPNSWIARDDRSIIRMEGGSLDELTLYSISGVASLNFSADVEIEE